MGRMSDRIANRRNPMFSHAKELVNGAVLAASTADASALLAQLDAKLDTLSAKQFEDAIGLAYLELRQRRDGEDAIRTLVEAARDVSQTFEREDRTVLTLFGLALQVFGAIGNKLSQAQVQAVVAAMVRHGLVADAKAAVLPRFLTSRESNALRAGEVYALSRALVGADATGVQQLFQSEMLSSPGADEPTGAASREGFVAIIVGVVAAKDGTTFPLPEGVQAQLPPVDASGIQPIGYAFTPPHLLEDLQRKLAAFSADAAVALQCSSVQVTQPAGTFAQANMHAVNLQRAQRTRALLAQLASGHGNGSLAGLVVGPAEPVETGLSAPVYRRLDRAAVGALQWPLARYEPAQDGLLQLLTLLDEMGLLDVPDDGAASRLMH